MRDVFSLEVLVVCLYTLTGMFCLLLLRGKRRIDVRMLYLLWYFYREVDYSRSHRLFWVSFCSLQRLLTCKILLLETHKVYYETKDPPTILS